MVLGTNDVQEEIELLRIKLQLLIDDTEELIDPAIINISQKLDMLICSYYLATDSTNRL